MASASASVSKNGTNRPFRPERMTSRTGAVSDPMTRAPHAIASKTDQDKSIG